MILLVACILTPSEVEDPREALKDQDRDGQQSTAYGGLDCDDGDPEVFVGAGELCDAIDNDCDGQTDEGWYVDADADGYFSTDEGNCGLGRAAQEQPGDDCDDGAEDVHPGALASCEQGTDLNCNGVEDLQDPDADADGDGYADCLDDCAPTDPSAPWLAWPDVDGDGFGDADAEPQLACDEQSGFVDNDQDCDDGDDALHPNTRWYLDEDGDGYGTEAYLVRCAEPSGHARYSGDCDDQDVDFHPGAPETDCSDPSDYNCDGSVGFSYSDSDGWAACLECNDADGQIHPDATEVCDDVDNDCDSTIDAQFVGASSGDNAGASLRVGGDYDGDGHLDLLIGAPYADGGGNSDAGAAYLFLGQGL